MNRLITLAGKTFKAKDITYNTVAEFEEHGVSIQKFDANVFRTARAYVAICAHITDEAAGDLIEQHVIGGGSMEDVYVALREKIEESDFFHALRKKAENAETETE